MKILVIGSGAREHALVWKLNSSKQVEEVFCAPGNAGIAREASCVDIGVEDIDGLLSFAKEQEIDLTVVGPEAPLMLGITEKFQGEGLKIFAPSSAAAAIEGSKDLAKGLMLRANVPTADYETFEELDRALAYVKKKNRPFVVKADGLAAGKGVVVAQSVEETLDAITDMLEGGRFGGAGAKVVVEEVLQGPEVSVLCFTDGKSVRPMVWAQDHKRALNGDKGPNTGGMGAFSPPKEFTEEFQQQILETVLEPIVKQMAAEGRTYVGVLYAGLMLTPMGPKVLEFNARFGDPETQVVLMRLESDLVEIMLSCIEGTLHTKEILWSKKKTCGVVLASGGYPGAYKKGLPIAGLEDNPATLDEKDVLVFHAGTKQEGDQVVTAGGRVLTVCAQGDALSVAVDKAYAALEEISFEGMAYRTDIAQKSLA
ncbi:phosphoribosylamine--glycine ligase [Clostridia bacterium]|nr:phosphoribosylamine--glycine ligase [Clostridia bacterium]